MLLMLGVFSVLGLLFAFQLGLQKAPADKARQRQHDCDDDDLDAFHKGLLVRVGCAA